MKSLITKPFLAGAFILSLIMVLSGCETCKPGMAGPPGQYTIEVALSDSLKDKNVLVDLVGVTPLSLPAWETYDMGKYWTPGDDKRQDADKVQLSFSKGKSSTLSMAITDAKWQAWKAKGVSHVLVLVDLPGMQTSRPGNQDARRQILSLGTCIWPKKTTVLSVQVKSSGVEVLTPLRPPS